MNENLIKKIQDLVVSELTSIYEEANKAESKLKSVTEELGLKEVELGQVTDKIDSIKADTKKILLDAEKRDRESKELENKIRVEEQRLKNLSTLVAEEVAVGKKTLEDISIEIKNLNEERRRREEQDLIDNDAKIKELRAELAKRLPALDAREKALKTKEADLGIVEQRWKKMFSEKGMGFKI